MPADLDSLFDQFGAVLDKRKQKRSADKAAEVALVASGVEVGLSVVGKRRRLLAKTKTVVATSSSVAPSSSAAASPSVAASSSVAASPSAAASSIVAAVSGAGRPPAPSPVAMAPMSYKNTKIYTDVKNKLWRVYPFPGRPVYERKFRWKGSPAVAWQKLLDFCDNPSVNDRRKCDIDG